MNPKPTEMALAALVAPKVMPLPRAEVQAHLEPSDALKYKRKCSGQSDGQLSEDIQTQLWGECQRHAMWERSQGVQFRPCPGLVR